MKQSRCYLEGRKAFTLVEILVAMAILSVLVLLLASLLGGVNRAWISGEQQVQTFQDGRAIIELISRELAQAAISPNLQMVQNAKLTGISQRANADNLFWQANLNSTAAGSLTEIGYFLDSDFRLMRFVVPPTDASNYQIFSAPPSDESAAWTDSASTQSLTTVVSANVIAFWIRCFDGNGDPIPWLSDASPPAAPLRFNSAARFQPAILGQPSSFKYTSASTTQANLLPGSIELTLVTIDSKTLTRSRAAVPAMPTVTSPTEIPDAIASFNQRLITNKISNAHTFSTRVSMKARGL